MDRTYQYQKLTLPRQFRLLKVHSRSPVPIPDPGQPSESLVNSYDLITTTLDDCPDYEPVSYVWGDGLPTAKLELKSSVKNAGVGVGFFAAAGVLLVFSLTFGFIALAEGLVAMGLWRWLSYLIVFGPFLLIVIVLVLMGVSKVKKVRGPQKTIETSKDTVAYLKANTGRS